VLRDLAHLILEDCGYRILEASSGKEAMAVWDRHEGKIDLLLTDMVLPDKLSGRELAEKLKKNRAQLKVIFSSGYSPEVIGKEFVLKSGQQFLQKPYDLQKLALTVRNSLDRLR